jgi:N-acetylglucosamine-6-phosphate deacetylase
VEGVDSLDAGDPIGEIAARLPKYGVTSFCPTTVACTPRELSTILAAVSRLKAARPPLAARVLPAHLESNFINPQYRGAQPAECLCLPPAPDAARVPDGGRASPLSTGPLSFSTADVLDVLAEFRADVGIVTLAPELPGGIELVRALVSAGHRVSLGHSGASLDEAVEAIEAGARQVTHLFNRMTPITHRAPGLAVAALAHEEVAAELICDGYHVHPAMCRVAIAAKGPGRIMAITDGTAGSGIRAGAEARLGGRRIRVTESAAVLEDGTLAGSTLTMDRAFRNIVTAFGGSVVDAALMCSTTPARELGLTGFGAVARDCIADLAVLDRDFRVVRTFIDGHQVYAAPHIPGGG